MATIQEYDPPIDESYGYSKKEWLGQYEDYLDLELDPETRIRKLMDSELTDIIENLDKAISKKKLMEIIADLKELASHYSEQINEL